MTHTYTDYDNTSGIPTMHVLSVLILHICADLIQFSIYEPAHYC